MNFKDAAWIASGISEKEIEERKWFEKHDDEIYGEHSELENIVIIQTVKAIKAIERRDYDHARKVLKCLLEEVEHG